MDRILALVDGSRCAKRAASHAFDIALRYGATVDVLHAPARPGHGDEVVAAAADLAPTGVDVETHLPPGQPHERIAAHVRDHGIDLVVMGREGRGGLSEWLLGSTAERVLRAVDAPVLTVPDGPVDGADYDDVLVTTDGSENAEAAAPLASKFAGRLHVLTAIDVAAEAGVFDAGGVDDEYVDRLVAEGEAAVDRMADLVGDEVERTVVRGSPVGTIREYVDEHGIDLVVVASKGETSAVGRHLGTVAGRILGTVDVPVLVVPVTA